MDTWAGFFPDLWMHAQPRLTVNELTAPRTHTNTPRAVHSLLSFGSGHSGCDLICTLCQSFDRGSYKYWLITFIFRWRSSSSLSTLCCLLIAVLPVRVLVDKKVTEISKINTTTIKTIMHIKHYTEYFMCLTVLIPQNSTRYFSINWHTKRTESRKDQTQGV